MESYDNPVTAAEPQTFGSLQEAEREREGKVAKAIEKRTARVPSDIFLWGAGAAIVGSLALQLFGMRRRTGMIGTFGPLHGQARAPLAEFVGMWAPTLLLLGVYNKIVKVAGSDRYQR